MTDFDSRDLRNAFGSFATGVTIVTSAHDGRDVGLTANSFSSVSLDPPLILWSLDRKSASLALFEKGDAFAVHVLSADQEDLSNRFAGKADDRFAGLELERGAGDIPLLKECAARFECRKAYAYDGGDHVIFVGEVLNYHHSKAPPLLFHSGKYKRAHSSEAGGESRISLVTNIARVNLLIREEAMAITRKQGLSWPDVTVLGVVVRSGPMSVDEAGERIAAAGLLLDDAMLDRLSLAAFMSRKGDLLEATPKGAHFATRVAAAARAREMELQLRTGRTSQDLSEIISSLANAYAIDTERNDPLMEMGEMP